MEKSRVVASKLAGKAKKTAAVIKGELGVLGSLEEDHGEVRSLMRQLSKTSDTHSGVALRIQLFERLRRELLAHTRAEEAVFYSVLKQHDETRRRTLNSMQEHHEIEELLTRVDAIDPHELGWLTMFERLRDAFFSHVDEEENTLFPQAQRLLTRDRIYEMDEAFQVEKERALRGIDAGLGTPMA